MGSGTIPIKHVKKLNLMAIDFVRAAGSVSAATLGYITGGIKGAKRAAEGFNAYENSKRSRIGATIGKIPGKQLPKNFNKMPKSRVMKKKPAKSTKVNVRKQIMALADTKHFTEDNNNIVASMLQSNLYTYNITKGIVQGTTNAGRNGDEVFLGNLKIRGHFITPATPTGGYMARCIIGWSGAEYNPGQAPIGVGLGTTDLFLPGTSGGNNTLSIINPKAFTPIADIMIEVNSYITGVRDISSFAKDVKINQKFQYKSSGAIYGKTKNLYLIFTGFVTNGAPTTTPCGDLACSIDLSFKDF